MFTETAMSNEGKEAPGGEKITKAKKQTVSSIYSSVTMLSTQALNMMCRCMYICVGRS